MSTKYHITPASGPYHPRVQMVPPAVMTIAYINLLKMSCWQGPDKSWRVDGQEWVSLEIPEGVIERAREYLTADGYSEMTEEEVGEWWDKVRYS